MEYVVARMTGKNRTVVRARIVPSKHGGDPAMARILALIVVAVLLLLPVIGRTQDDPVAGLTQVDRGAIRKVIEAQLSALQHDDGALAFSYSSPFIQEKFGTPENFLRMVKTAFPAVYRPRDTQFRELDVSAELPVQQVFFIGPDGEPVLGLYLMEKQPDGSWKINGCKLAKAPDIST